MTSTLPKSGATTHPAIAEIQAELDSRNAQLAVVNEIGAALAKQLDFQGIVDAVGVRLAEIFDSGDMFIAILDEQAQMIEFPYWIENGKRDDSVPAFPMGEGLTSQIILSGTPIRLNTSAEAEALGARSYGEPQESFLGVPIPVGDRTIGVLSLSAREASAFSEADERLVSTVASSMGVALESARRFDETKRLLGQTEQQNAELAVVNEVGQALAKQLDLNAVTELVGERLHSIFADVDLFVAFYDKETNLISFPYEIGHGERYHTEPIRADKGLTATVIKTRQSLLIHTHEEAEKHGAIFVLEDEMARTESWLGVPIVAGDDLIGVLALESGEPNTFDEDARRLVETIASSTAVALHNARLFDQTNSLLAETEQRAAELAIINEIGAALAEQLDFDAIVDLVGDRLSEMFKSNDFYIALIDRTKNLITFPYELDGGKRVYADPIEFGQGVTSRVIAERRAYRFATLDEQSQVGGAVIGTYAEIPEGVAQDQLTQSWLGVPIMAGREAIGVVVLGDRRPNIYTEADERLVSTISQSMGVALENARLFDETKHLLAETEQRNAELAVINEIGEALAKELDFQGIIDAVGERIRSIFAAPTSGIILYDSVAGTVTPAFMIDHGERVTGIETRPLGGLSADVINGRSPLRIGTLEELQKHNPYIVGREEELSQSWLGVPVLAGNRVLGVITLERQATNAFSENDERLLSTIAQSMGVALENARLFDETKHLLGETTQVTPSWPSSTRSARRSRSSSTSRGSSTPSATESDPYSTSRPGRSRSTSLRRTSSQPHIRSILENASNRNRASLGA